MGPVDAATIIVGAASNETTTHTVSYDGTAFTPTELTIAMGDTVIWQNNGDAPMAIMGSGSAGSHGHGDHGTDGKESPGAPLLLVGLALLGAVLVARRS